MSVRDEALLRLINLLPVEDFTAGRAACTEADPELFQPISEADEHRIAAAKNICQSCPIQGSCLQFALRTGEDHGIWGGLSAGERRRVRVLRHEAIETKAGEFGGDDEVRAA